MGSIMTITEKDREELQRHREDLEYFEKQKDNLKRMYPNQWVAIYNKDIVEVNEDFEKLLENLRVKKIHPGHTVIEFLSTAEDIWIFIGKNYIPTDLPQNRQEELGELFQRIPSLLGRDIIGQFGLFMHENTRRIFLLKDNEIPDALFSSY